jgi:hypothetical protein
VTAFVLFALALVSTLAFLLVVTLAMAPTLVWALASATAALVPRA